MFPIDFQLPPERIAQEPCSPRDHARLLVVRREESVLEQRRFFDLPDLLRPGDLLVLNDTRVLPARLLGQRSRTAGKWEGLYLRTLEDGTWEMLCKSGGKPQAGETIDVLPGPLVLHLVEKLPEGRWRVRPDAPGTAADLLQLYGHVPLPPYIRKGEDRPEDRVSYQTVFAHRPGAVAAPTAGLHFTPELFARLQDRGIGTAFVTLHVGPGTFRPIEAEDFREHPMHAEWGELPETTAAAVHTCLRTGNRVVAVGTTSVRVLETAGRLGSLNHWSGDTDLFIHPPYEFQVVRGLITNFHLPRTTLLLLVAAFAGVELTQRAYREALAGDYRFYSYGDAMLIL